MKWPGILPSVWLVIALACFDATCRADCAVHWHRIARGGGTSIGGSYSLTGTIGQHDSSSRPMVGGNYSLTGGFWALYAIQSSGSPLLRIFLTGTNSVVLAWPTNAGPFSLQQNDDLRFTNWMNVAAPPNVVGTENQVTVSAPAEFRFYRLKYP